MQLLYGNDGNNYRTLAKTPDMDEHVEKALKDSYLFYQYVENEGNYSQIEKQPEAITYVTTDLGGILKKEYILIVKNARMSNFSTPCSYAHFILFEADRKSYGETFLPVIQSSFIRDKDTLLYDGEKLESLKPQIREFGDGGEFPEKVLKIIAGYIMLRDKSSAKVKVVMDVSGDSYNDRSMALIQEVYRHLPYDLRKKHGFSSYTGTQQNVPGRVKLELYNPESLKRIPEDFIDLNSRRTERLFEQLPLEYREYLDYIFSITDEQRNEHYNSISVGAVYLVAADYIDIYRSLARWSKEPIENIFSEWVDFSLSESRKKSPGYPIFQVIVAKRLDSETYNGRLSQCLRKQSEGGIERWSSELKDLIKFGEQIQSLEFKHEPFLEWFCSKLIPYFLKQYTDFLLIDKLDEEIRKVLEYKCGENFKKILDVLAVNITKLKEQKLQEINKKIGLEEEFIHNVLCPENIHEIQELEQASEELERKLNYLEQTKGTLKNAWISTYTGILNKVEQFFEASDYMAFQEALKRAPEYITEWERQNLDELLTEKHQWIEAVEKSREIQLLTELKGGRYKVKMEGLKGLLSQRNIRLQDCSLICIIGNEKIEMPYEDFLKLCDFIEYPSYFYEGVKQFFSENEERVVLMLHENCFNKQHLKYLLSFSDKTVCDVICHYCFRFQLDETTLSKAAQALLMRFEGKRELKEFIGMLRQQQEKNENLSNLIRLLEGKRIVDSENSDSIGMEMWMITITAVLAFCLVFLISMVVLPGKMQQIYVLILNALNIVFLIASMAFAWFFNE